MDWLRRVCDIRRIDRVKNKVVQNLCDVEKSLDEKVGESVLRWSGLVVKIDEVGVAKKVWQSKSSSNKSKTEK